MEIYPIVSWSFVLLLGGVVVYVYKPELLQKALPANKTPTQSAINSVKQSSKKPKTKKPKAVQDVLEAVTDKVVSSSEETRAKKKRKITAPVGPTVIATTVQGEQKELPRDTGNDIDDKSFAQQLAKAQAGTKLQSDSQQKKAALKSSDTTLQPKKSEDVLSTAELSSTTGQDADDDMSSVESIQQKSSSGRDISDMLEAPAAAPATLRLTNISDEQKKPKSAPKQFEQVQSKKKRNEQARREEQKRLREESDRVHEQKKQEQLRRARMAEGTSNQTKANTFTTTSNAWQNKKETTTSKTGAAPLLDTFEPSTSDAVAPSGVQTASMSKTIPSNNVSSLKSEIGSGAAGALAASGREKGPSSGWAERMSEEEQLQKLRDQEQDDAWESVTSKKTKKKTRAENDTSSEASFSAPQPAPVAVEKPAVKRTAAKTNGTAHSKETANRFDTIQPVSLEGLEDDAWAA